MKLHKQEGKSGEESSLYTRSKVAKEEKRQQFTDTEKENYEAIVIDKEVTAKFWGQEEEVD